MRAAMSVAVNRRWCIAESEEELALWRLAGIRSIVALRLISDAERRYALSDGKVYYARVEELYERNA